MHKTLGAALLAAAIGLGSAGAALAQGDTGAAAPAAPAAPPAAPAAAPDAGAMPAAAVKSGPPSIDWPIQDLLADPGAKGVLDKDLPALAGDPRLDMVKTLSLRAVAQYPEAQIDQAKLDSIQADLAALPKPAT